MVQLIHAVHLTYSDDNYRDDGGAALLEHGQPVPNRVVGARIVEAIKPGTPITYRAHYNLACYYSVRGELEPVEKTRTEQYTESLRHLEQALLPGDCQNVIVLSEEFYREISSHPIPTDLEAAKALSASPAALDLFT